MSPAGGCLYSAFVSFVADCTCLGTFLRVSAVVNVSFKFNSAISVVVGVG